MQCSHYYTKSITVFLQKSIKSKGADLPQAVLEYIRNSDVAVLEGCDMVSNYSLSSEKVLYLFYCLYSFLGSIKKN